MRKILFFVVSSLLTFYLHAGENSFPDNLKGRWGTLDNAYSQVIEINKEGSQYLITHWSTRTQCTMKKAPAVLEKTENIFTLKVITKDSMPCSSYYRIELVEKDGKLTGYIYTDLSSAYQKLKVEFE